MVTKTSKKWKQKSGELDKLNTSCLFETRDIYGFPEVSTSEDFRAKDLEVFHLAKNTSKYSKRNAVHFFLDDYKFEQIWTRPKDFVKLFSEEYAGIVSPTFSIWENQPCVMLA